jgi:hypothetical protein
MNSDVTKAVAKGAIAFTVCAVVLYCLTLLG